MKKFVWRFLCLLKEAKEATAIPTVGFKLRWCWEAMTTGKMETTMGTTPKAVTVMDHIARDNILAEQGTK
jgi:Na+/glutamate symporter